MDGNGCWCHHVPIQGEGVLVPLLPSLLYERERKMKEKEEKTATVALKGGIRKSF